MLENKSVKQNIELDSVLVLEGSASFHRGRVSDGRVYVACMLMCCSEANAGDHSDYEWVEN